MKRGCENARSVTTPSMTPKYPSSTTAPTTPLWLVSCAPPLYMPPAPTQPLMYDLIATRSQIVHTHSFYLLLSSPSLPSSSTHCLPPLANLSMHLSGVVLFFLVRLEPFTSLHIQMQDGHLDVPDRLFSSIPSVFRLCTTSLSEVKELVPEFYYMPEFLTNVSRWGVATNPPLGCF